MAAVRVNGREMYRRAFTKGLGSVKKKVEECGHGIGTDAGRSLGGSRSRMGSIALPSALARSDRAQYAEEISSPQ
jgi:hypothetical protein